MNPKQGKLRVEPIQREEEKAFCQRGFAVRTGRNETRFVLPKVKLQSRLSSGEAVTQMAICVTKPLRYLNNSTPA
ncbi:MAG: hypothetical protein DMF72_14680 [Acidobacteria bacterium]|nr:MAG: hypothetical protein DMF72_14680 [Acidobacteriota bacterium]